MGVKGLWAELQPAGRDVALARLHENLEKGTDDDRPDKSSSGGNGDVSRPTTPVRLGIDIAGWLYHAQKAQGGRAPQLRNLFYRMCRLLSLPHLQPVFVFDGPARPSMKRGRIVFTGTDHGDDEQTMHEEVGPSFLSKVKALIEAFGFTWLDAPGEAEAELADLNRRGLLDAVMSDDVDALVFGAKVVVRFWGADLSSIKARSTYLSAKQNGEDKDGASSALSDPDEEHNLFIDKANTTSAKLTSAEQKTLQENSVTTFTDKNVAEEIGLQHFDLVLVAMLSGGDYDVKGLARCGVKIAIALAKAGFGKELYEGALEHLTPSSGSQSPSLRNGRPVPPKARAEWATFLHDWRERLCAELRSNSTGLLGRKLKKLADSTELPELLSTPAALAVLGTYIWPVVSGRREPIPSGQLRLSRLAEYVQDTLGWHPDFIMESFRTKVWPGCATRLLLGQTVADVSLKSLAQSHKGARNGDTSAQGALEPTKTSKSKKHGPRISSFFSRSDAKTSVEAKDDDLPVFVESDISFERQHASSGFLPELRLELRVADFADAAKLGLDPQSGGNSEANPESEAELPSSQTSSTYVSPRKPRQLTNIHNPIRIWLARDLVLLHVSGRRAYAQFEKGQSAKAAQKAKDAQRKSMSDSRQAPASAPISFFFQGGRPQDVRERVPPAHARTTREKSRNSAPPSDSVNVSPSKRKSARPQHRPAESRTAISLLSSQGEDAISSRNDDATETEDDERVLRQTLPYRPRGDAGDESIEFIKVTKGVSPRTAPERELTGSVTISDGSDED